MAHHWSASDTLTLLYAHLCSMLMQWRADVICMPWSPPSRRLLVSPCCSITKSVLTITRQCVDQGDAIFPPCDSGLWFFFFVLFLVQVTLFHFVLLISWMCIHVPHFTSTQICDNFSSLYRFVDSAVKACHVSMSHELVQWGFFCHISVGAVVFLVNTLIFDFFMSSTSTNERPPKAQNADT